jgi:hypothetical protein
VTRRNPALREIDDPDAGNCPRRVPGESESRRVDAVSASATRARIKAIVANYTEAGAWRRGCGQLTHVPLPSQ